MVFVGLINHQFGLLSSLRKDKINFGISIMRCLICLNLSAGGRRKSLVYSTIGRSTKSSNVNRFFVWKRVSSVCVRDKLHVLTRVYHSHGEKRWKVQQIPCWHEARRSKRWVLTFESESLCTNERNAVNSIADLSRKPKKETLFCTGRLIQDDTTLMLEAELRCLGFYFVSSLIHTESRAG